MPKSTCCIEGCDRPRVSSPGWCNAHYKRWKRHGNPLGKYRMHGLALAEAFTHHCPGSPPASGCWMWQSTLNFHGYGVFGWNETEVRANRVSYELFNGPIAEGLIVRHTCDTPACVQPAHLILGTMADNSRDMTDRERQCRGEKFSSSKLTDSAVREIRDLYASGTALQRDLAQRFGISQTTVSTVVNRKAWKHI